MKLIDECSLCFSHSANGSDDLTPRKRARKQQLSEYSSQAVKRFQLDLSQGDQQPIVGSTMNELDENINYQTIASGSAIINATASLSNQNSIKNNNENSPPKNFDFYIKRPKTCKLLDVSEMQKFMLV